MTDKNDLVPTDEDIAAGAYFPEASSWIEIGERRLKYQIECYIRQLAKITGGKKQVAFPVDTFAALYLLSGLGYSATRKNFDYFIRHRLMRQPRKDGNRLLWTIEDVISFGMQLERMRYWLPGRHVEKKTVFELQEEADANARAAAVATEVGSLDAAAILQRIVMSQDVNEIAVMAQYVPIRLWERGIQMDAAMEKVLELIVNAKDASRRGAHIETFTELIKEKG